MLLAGGWDRDRDLCCPVPHCGFSYTEHKAATAGTSSYQNLHLTASAPDLTALQESKANTTKAPAGFVKKGENCSAAAAQSQVRSLLTRPADCRHVDLDATKAQQKCVVLLTLSCSGEIRTNTPQ